MQSSCFQEARTRTPSCLSEEKVMLARRGSFRRSAITSTNIMSSDTWFFSKTFLRCAQKSSFKSWLASSATSLKQNRVRPSKTKFLVDKRSGLIQTRTSFGPLLTWTYLKRSSGLDSNPFSSTLTVHQKTEIYESLLLITLITRGEGVALKILPTKNAVRRTQSNRVVGITQSQRRLKINSWCRASHWTLLKLKMPLNFCSPSVKGG